MTRVICLLIRSTEKPFTRKRGEYGFGEYGFNTELSEFLSAYYFVCQSELIEFFAELTEFAVKLSEAQ